MMPAARPGWIGALAGAFLLAAACSDDGAESPLSPSILPALGVQELITALSVQGLDAIARPGAAPTPGSGPAVGVTGNTTVVNGGTLAANLAGAQPFQTVYLYVGASTVGVATATAGGVDGYYELRFPSPQTDVAALLALAQTIPLAQLDLMFAVADDSGRVGPYARLSTAVTPVGTGDVQVTLSWDADSDVDLHVIDPAGEEVYYGHRSSASGGELDLDSNAGCAIDGVRNENITWPVGRAPRGTYTVRVDYWSSCGESQTNYTVRVNNGGSVQIFTGTFTGNGDQGGAGSGRPITVFERLTGPTAATPSAPTSSGAGIKTYAVRPR